MLEVLGLGMARGASSTVGKMVGGPLAQRLDRARLRSALQKAELSPLASDAKDVLELLTTSQVKALSDFVASSDYEVVARRIVIDCFSKSSAHSASVYEQELTELLRIRIRLYQEHANALAKIVMQHLTTVIETYLVESQQSKIIPTELLAKILPTAASARSISHHHVSVLDKILELEPILEFEDQIRSQVIAIHGRISPPHSAQFEMADLNDLFVAPDIFLPQGERVRLSAVLESSSRLVIKGDPGGGKSTLAAKIAIDIAAGMGFWPTRSATPFLLTLRDFAKQYDSPRPARTIVEHLADLSRSPYQVEPPVGAIEYLLLNGHAVVIFDGLDELTNIAHRASVVRDIHAFANLYVDTPIIVTSRRIGYEVAPLNPELFQTIQIGPFSSEAVVEYVHKWFAHDPKLPRHRQSELADSFVRASDDIHDIRSNPLMLGLMCSLYATERWIPNNRPELYEKCSLLLYQTWDRNREIEGHRPFNTRVKQTVSALALWMLSSDASQSGVGKRAVTEFIVDQLTPNAYESRAEAEDAAIELVEYWTGRAWILTDVGGEEAQELYAFTHRTFLEYFAALEIWSQCDTVGELYSRLSAWISVGTQDVVCQICLQLLRDRRQESADKFLAMILDDTRDAILYGDGSSAVSSLSFLVRSLAFVVPSTAVRRSITRAAASQSVQTPQLLNDSGGTGLLHELFCADPDNLSIIGAEIADYFGGSDWDTRPIPQASLAMLVYPVAFARASAAYSESRHGDFWRNKAMEYRAIAYASADETVLPFGTWWTLHLVARRKTSVAELSGTGIIWTLQDNIAPGTRLPSFAQRLLYSMSANCAPEDADDIDPTLPLDADEADLFTRLLLRHPLPWREVSSSAAPVKSKYRTFEFGIAGKPREVVGLYAVLAAIEADRAFSEMDPDVPVSRRVAYWNQLTMGQFQNFEITTMPVTREVEGFFARWLGSGIRTVVRASSA
ncbi:MULTISPECIES: NACHT domain-containing protein [Nocardia]|uniref:NACHT domain-containing protein n=1 Tax=Nocardia TaxID=1817 RepID=UPI002458ED69|nr:MULTISPECIES: NACHT domain-containing protein [Nocardia]